MTQHAMQTLFGALRAIKPNLPQPQRSVTTIPKFWEFMVKGSAPLVMMKNKLGEDLGHEKEKIALGYLEEVLAGKQGELTSDAWLGVGGK